jgi:hypothetical protein
VIAIVFGGWIDHLLQAAAALTACAVIWQKAIRPGYRFIVSIGHGVDFVREQMVNNGGSTLKDAVDRTEALALETVDRLDKIDQRVEFLEEVHRKQEIVEQIVAENAARLAGQPKESS